MRPCYQWFLGHGTIIKHIDAAQNAVLKKVRDIFNHEVINANDTTIWPGDIDTKMSKERCQSWHVRLDDRLCPQCADLDHLAISIQQSGRARLIHADHVGSSGCPGRAKCVPMERCR